MRSQASAELARERIVAAAVGIADDEGIEALSLRKLARELKVPVMSLYRYVRSKDELLESMTDAVLAERLAVSSAAGGRAALELMARSEWKLMRRHPWLVRQLHATRARLTQGELDRSECVMRALVNSGLAASEKLELDLVLRAFVHGMVDHWATAGQAAADTGFIEDAHQRGVNAERSASSDGARHPHLKGVLCDLKDRLEVDVERLFEVGLSLMFDGIENAVFRRNHACSCYPAG